MSGVVTVVSLENFVKIPKGVTGTNVNEKSGVFTSTSRMLHGHDTIRFNYTTAHTVCTTDEWTLKTRLPTNYSLNYWIGDRSQGGSRGRWDNWK